MIALAGHRWDEATAVVVCDHVRAGSEVRTVHVDDDGTLCFQCGGQDDISVATVVCLEHVIDRPGLHDVPVVPVNSVAYREPDGNWTVEAQPDEDSNDL